MAQHQIKIKVEADTVPEAAQKVKALERISVLPANTLQALSTTGLKALNDPKMKDFIQGFLFQG